MTSFIVRERGTDSSGRTIFATDYMWEWLAATKADPAVAPFASKIVVTQGAFMGRNPGGGADASAGYHDLGGCVDFRLWNLTSAEAEAFIFAGRRRGGAVWRRDAAHGWGGESHMHATLGSDRPLTSGAQDSWNQYVNGDNGLTGSSHGRDLERRPSPLVLSFKPEDDDMQLSDKIRPDGATVRDALDAALDVKKALAVFRAGEAQRDKATRNTLDAILAELGENATREQIKRVRQRLTEVRDSLREQPSEGGL